MALKDLSKPRPPYKHPKVEAGWVRVELPEVGAATDKATLFDFKDPALKNHGLIWIPKNCFKIHWAGVRKGDDPSVLDIKEWFYQKEIEK